MAYALRHLYVTDALDRGVPVATLAELVGHRDATMILRVYSKLASRHQHLRDAAAVIRPGEPAVVPPPPPRNPAPPTDAEPEPVPRPARPEPRTRRGAAR